ncbi:MAG: hypothetical protein ABIK89_16950 [Planctomycetota bacterium]
MKCWTPWAAGVIIMTSADLRASSSWSQIRAMSALSSPRSVNHSLGDFCALFTPNAVSPLRWQKKSVE